MTEARYYDYEGFPISFEEWRELWQGNRRVARNQSGETVVVTSFLGLEGMVFETMVVVGDEEVEMVRTRCLDDAKEMHERMKDKWIDADVG